MKKKESKQHLLLEHGLGLTAEASLLCIRILTLSGQLKTHLLAVIAPLALGSQAGLARLLLPGNGVRCVLHALLAVRTLLLREVDHLS